jgi:hypothetical protein
MTILCQHGCGQPATYTTKGSLKSGPFNGAPVSQCSKSHNACPAIKQKKIDTSINNYGTAYPWQTEDIKQKRNQTNLDKYGHISSIMNPEIQAKRKATMMDRYGVEEPTLNEEIRLRAAAGVKQSYINDPELANKQIQIRKDKYGEDYAGPVAKRRATQIANGRWVDPAKRTEWAQYKFRVKYLTAKAYKKFKSIINPDDLPIGLCEYQVDHIYSIRHGFENNVDPAIIANIANLRLLWHTENKSKHIRSDHTLEELLAKTKGT